MYWWQAESHESGQIWDYNKAYSSIDTAKKGAIAFLKRDEEKGHFTINILDGPFAWSTSNKRSYARREVLPGDIIKTFETTL